MKKKFLLLMMVFLIIPMSNLIPIKSAHAYLSDGPCPTGRCWDFKKTFEGYESSLNGVDGLYFDGGSENKLSGTIYNPYRNDVTIVFDFYTSSGAHVLTHSKRTSASQDSYSWDLSSLKGLYKIKVSWRGQMPADESYDTYTTGRVYY